MAANTAQIYPLTGIGPPVSVTAVNADITGASGSLTTIVTFGTNGTQIGSIRFRALSNTGAGVTIHIFYTSGGSHLNVGSVQIPPGIDPGQPDTLPPESLWSNPAFGFPMKAGDKFEAAMTTSGPTVVAWAIGADY